MCVGMLIGYNVKFTIKCLPNFDGCKPLVVAVVWLGFNGAFNTIQIISHP